MDQTQRKMKKIYLYIIVFLVSTSAIYGQSMKAWESAAQQAFEFKDYYAALVYWQNALEIDDTRRDLQYKCAEAARMINSYKVAEKYYEMIVKEEKNGGYPDASFYLAEMKFYLGKYEEAKKFYEMYVSESDGDDAVKSDRARRMIQSVEFAKVESKVEFEDVNIEHLGASVNTPFSEFAPFLLGDSLFYSSLRFENKKDSHKPKRPISKVLISKDGAAGVPIEDGFNLEQLHTSHTSFTADRSRIYLTICEWMNGADIRCDLYYKDRQADGKYGEAVKLPDNVNTAQFTSTQPNICISKETGKQTLYFVSDREGGKGGYDIWYTELDQNGNFSDAVNLEAINTAEDEITPFYNSNSGVLFFSSNGLPGLGGYDIYRTEYRNGRWLTPENLSVPYNSSFNDLYYIELDDNSGAYFASNRDGGTFLDSDREACCNDIYKAEFIDIEIDLLALTFDRLTNEKLAGATVTLVDISDPTNPRGVTNLDGNEFKFPLDRAKDYMVVASKDGFFPDSAAVSTKRIRKSTQVKKELFLRTTRLDLDLYTFEKRNNNPLNGTTITIIDRNDPDNELIIQMDDETNNLLTAIERDKEYLIVASKRGYSQDTAQVNTRNINDINKITRNLYLGLGNLEDFLPLTLYFDNDEPDRRTTKTRTTLRYEQTYPPYYAKRQEFINAWASPLDGEEKRRAEEEVRNFFDKEVKQGNEFLRTFIALLEKALIDENQKIEIVLQGYASPRASQAYNEALSKRRISSVMNQVTKYSDGKLNEYLQSKQLIIREQAYGSRRAPRYVSGSIKDTRNSIYSIPASRERRVEIIQVKRDTSNRR